MFEKGKLIPAVQLKDHEGVDHNLWDYRQKSHVALVIDPEGGPVQALRYAGQVSAQKKTWDWLNVKVIVVTKAPAGLTPGAYAIDRYGIFLNAFPLDDKVLENLENEFLNYEAKHC